MKRPNLTLPFRSLSLNIFFLITLFLLVPVYIGFIFIKRSNETYIQRELNNQIITTIQKGEGEFLDTFQKMAVISNVFTLDRELLAILRDENSSYWDRNKRFDELVNTLRVNNLFSLDGIRITMFDDQKRNYANWGLYFNDYSFVMDESWVIPSLIHKELISWSLFTPSFILGENENYISLARSILYPSYSGERLATIIISINEQLISALLKRNDQGADFIRVCTAGTLEDVFTAEKIKLLRKGDLEFLLEKPKSQTGDSLLCEVDGKRYLLSYYTLGSPLMAESERLKVLYFLDYQRITDRLSALSLSINYGMLILLVILLGIVVFISGNIARPIRMLSNNVKAFTETRKISTFPGNRKDEIGELGRAFTDMEIKINDLFNKLKEESEIREQYRFKALRAQINPHFLFNTLNTVRWMALIRKADNIVDTINALSRILDYSMGLARELASLGEELEMIQNYAHIQNYRYGEDLEVTVAIDQGAEKLGLIKFILQPMVENSYLHAFKKIQRKKILHIAGRQSNGKLLLFVEDNGSGIKAEKLHKLRENLKEENNGEEREGIGLVNVHRRIRASYGEGYGISISSREGEGTIVEYSLPIIELPAEYTKARGAAG
jgi:two-component system sensor histidine kinase YesM